MVALERPKKASTGGRRLRKPRRALDERSSPETTDGHALRLLRVLDKPLFFIVATEDTDVGWLARMLDSHPHATCATSALLSSKLLPALACAMNDLARAAGRADGREPAAFRDEGRQLLERAALAAELAKHDSDAARIIGNAADDDIRRLSRLNALFPRAKFVVLVRDGRDIAVSTWESAKTRRPNPQFERRFSDHVRGIAHLWRQDVSSALRLSTAHPDLCLILKLEELQTDPEAALGRVLSFLDLDAESIVVRSCVAAAGPAPARDQAGWRAVFDHAAAGAFAAAAGETMATLGYPDAHPPTGAPPQEPTVDDPELVAQEAELRAAAAAKPDDPKAQFALAHFVWKTGRLGEALPMLERTRALAPENFFAANLLTMTLSRLGRTDEAIAAGQRALELKDKAALAFFHARAEFKSLKLRNVVKPFSEDPQRNVISFSLWGDKPMYTEGAVQNVEIARYMYPSWTCRFYVDGSVPKTVLERLRALGAQVMLVPPGERGPHGGAWRFYAADDTTIDRFISRDCDSRLNAQERMAVDDWVISGRAVHIMRDHVWHNELILGGLWGAVTGTLPPLKSLIAAGRWFGKSRWYDQFFLANVVWPLVREDHLAHDSFYRVGNARPFPPAGRLPSPFHVGGTVR